MNALEVWRRYNGRADIQNRIKEVDAQFGLRGFCLSLFWATAAARLPYPHPYNPCADLQRRLGAARRWWLALLQHFADDAPNRDAVAGFDARTANFSVKSSTSSA